jgi:hypothetical protein
MSDEAVGSRQAQVSALVPQLATTARAFLLYDVRNDAVRRLLDALLAGFAALLTGQPPLRLEIRPFEIEFEGRRVYLDRDREHSLAFRLYRDGVRALVFRDGFGGEELARLLEILSLRFTGIHQHEDDTVTLLWKAGMRSLDVIAVEGLTPEGGAADEADAARPREPRPYLPDDVDLPIAAPASETTPSWVAVEASELAALREEDAQARLPQDSLRLMAALVRSLEDPAPAMPLREAAHLCEEMRDALLSAETLPALLDFVRHVQQLARSEVAWDAGRHATAVELILSCGTDSAIRQLIHSVPSTQPKLRRELVELLDIACPDPFTAVTEALAAEDRPAGGARGRPNCSSTTASARAGSSASASTPPAGSWLPTCCARWHGSKARPPPSSSPASAATPTRRCAKRRSGTSSGCDSVLP